MGLPDGWTDIGEWTDSKGKVRQTSDSARYKALGNSIAIPFWKSLAKKISAQYDRDITMGGLFSGIGGFEKCFADCNGIENVKFTCEIDDFCNAVLERHFPGEKWDD